MTIVFFTSALSFVLESIVSNFIPLNSYIIVPAFAVVTLIIIYPYFKKNDMTYIKVAAGMGIIYDIVFTDTLLMNMLIFVILGFVIRFINSIISNNVVNISLMSIIVIILYRLISYIILCLAGFLTFNINSLVLSIYSSLLLNIIYVIIAYIITDRLASKYHIYKID